MSLYPHYKPVGIRPGWEHNSMATFGSGEVLRRHGVQEGFGEPTDAVAWFDTGGALRVLVADYANGQRATLRKRVNGSSLSIVTPEHPSHTTEQCGGVTATVNPDDLEICPGCDGSGQGVADTTCSLCDGCGGVPTPTLPARLTEGEVA